MYLVRSMAKFSIPAGPRKTKPKAPGKFLHQEWPSDLVAEIDELAKRHGYSRLQFMILAVTWFVERVRAGDDAEKSD